MTLLLCKLLLIIISLGYFSITDAIIPFSLYGKEKDDDARNQLDKGDIIDLDDTNVEITDNRVHKPDNRDVNIENAENDNDDIEIGPYDDIFDDVEIMKLDNESLFKPLTDGNNLEKNETKTVNNVDDEDGVGGSGSGDVEIEIEENSTIVNTTDDLQLSENVSSALLSGENRLNVSKSTIISKQETAEENESGVFAGDTVPGNLPPFCQEASTNITWAPWSPWIQAGDVDIRFRRCSTDKGISGVNRCSGNYIETRQCDQRDVTVCRGPNGQLLEEHHVSCDGIDMDDVKHIEDLRSPDDRQDPCEYTLYDLKYNMPIGSTLTTDGLMASNPNMWCGSGDKHIVFYTQTSRCLNNLNIFCKSSQRCKYENRLRKPEKNRGALNKQCWRNFVLGGVLPVGIPFGRSGKLICQRFSKDGLFGKVLGYKDDHYATLYDTHLRMPIMSMATVRVLADEKWPNIPHMIEQGFIQDDSKVISTFYKDRKKGIIRPEEMSDTCQVDKCKLGERQAIPDDFVYSGYRIVPLITPDIIGGTLAMQLSTFTLTNAAPMEPTVFSSWKKVLKTVRNFEEQECRIPIEHYNDNSEVHTSRYGHELPEVYILSGAYASRKHINVIGNDVTVPELFWLAVCCAHGADVASFGVYVHNEFQARPKIVSIETLQNVLRIYDDLNQTDVKLYPAFDSVCSAVENNISYRLYL